MLLSDNSAGFSNQILANICKHYNIEETFVIVEHPANNGLVERTNKNNPDVLRNFVGKSRESWENWLPQVQTFVNGSIDSSTGKAPRYISYGLKKRVPCDLLMQSPTPVYSLKIL